MDARNYCDLKFVRVGGDGTLVIEIKRGWGYNLDCDKEQAKVDKINDKRIADSKGDFRDIQG